MKNEVVLVTGATSGLGRACAEHLHALGYSVYGTGRSATQYVGTTEFTIESMDVTDDASVTTAVKRILDREGKIDILISNAGNGIAGSIEDTTLAEAQEQFDTNFFGSIRVVKAVLPTMRERGSGKIIFTGSIAGRAAVPFQGFYSASKFAIEGFVEALRMETKHFGIRCTILEPGDFHTGFTASRRLVKEARSSAYTTLFEKSLGVMENDERHGYHPNKAAKLVAKIIQKKHPRVRYTVGPAFERFAIGLKRLLSSRLYESLFSMYYKVS